MCTFIYLVIPADKALKRLKPGGIGFRPVDNEAPGAGLRARETLCLALGLPLCAGGGHCDSVLVRGRRRVEAPRVDELSLWNDLLQRMLVDARLPYLGMWMCDAGAEASPPEREEAVTLSEFNISRLEKGVLYRIRH